MKLLLFFVIIPLLAAFLDALIAGRLKKGASLFANFATFCLFILSLQVAGLVKSHKAVVFAVGGWVAPLGISLVVDGLSALLLLVINLIGFLVMLYAVNYMRHFTGQWQFRSLFMLMLAGLNGVVISGDLFNLYVFLEVASIAGYALVAFGVEPEDLEASFKYMIMGSIASLFILFGIGLLYSYTSTLNLADMASFLAVRPAGMLISFVSVLFLAGFGLKAALVPFHAWLPDAHSSAPSPVSATLSGVVIKVLGIYTLSRVFFCVLGVSHEVLLAMMVLGVFSMVLGGLLAVAQHDLKRMLAYSSISQIGYISFALGVGTPLAILGGLFHLFNHAVSKSLLFINAGSIEQATGTRNMNQLGGLGSKLPYAGCSSLVAALSISGVPPFGGFFSKLIIIIAAIQAGYISFSIIAVIVSIITLIYYLKFQTQVFSGKCADRFQGIRELSGPNRFVVVVLAVISLFSGLLLLPSFRQFLTGAADVLLSGINYKDLLGGILR